MSRPKFRHINDKGAFHPRNGRDVCFCLTALCITTVVLWSFTRLPGADALKGITAEQCQMLLYEFRQTFVRDGDGYPLITSCSTQVIQLMWAQQIQRVYSSASGVRIDSYNDIRTLPDAQFAKLVVNAAAGSLMDSTQQATTDPTIRIRVDTHGHFQRYVLNDTNRITALQTMLVFSIVTIAVTWWRIEMKKSA